MEPVVLRGAPGIPPGRLSLRAHAVVSPEGPADGRGVEDTPYGHRYIVHAALATGRRSLSSPEEPGRHPWSYAELVEEALRRLGTPTDGGVHLVMASAGPDVVVDRVPAHELIARVPGIVSAHSVLDCGPTTLAAALETAAAVPGGARCVAVVLVDLSGSPVEVPEGLRPVRDCAVALLCDVDGAAGPDAVDILRGGPGEGPETLVAGRARRQGEGAVVVADDAVAADLTAADGRTVLRPEPGLPTTGALLAALGPEADPSRQVLLVSRDPVGGRAVAVVLPPRRGA